MKKGQTSKRGSYQDLLCPFTTVYVSQYSDRGTHKGSKAYDVTNGDGVRASYYAPCDVKCVAIIPSYGEAIWQSLNKVRFANGKIDYYTFTTVHDNSFDAYVGMTRKQGEQIGNMGNKPTNICTGVHCHIEGCYGKTNALVKNKYGVWILKSFNYEVLPRDTFFMDGTNIKKWYKPKYLKDVPVKTTEVVDQILHVGSKVKFDGVFKVDILKRPLSTNLFGNSRLTGVSYNDYYRGFAKDYHWIPLSDFTEVDKYGNSQGQDDIVAEGKSYVINKNIYEVKKVDIKTNSAKLEINGHNVWIYCTFLYEV